MTVAGKDWPSRFLLKHAIERLTEMGGSLMNHSKLRYVSELGNDMINYSPKKNAIQFSSQITIDQYAQQILYTQLQYCI